MRDIPPHWGLRPLLFKNSVCVFFNVPQNLFVQEVWDGVYGLSSSSKEAWKSYRLQMSLQRQHFLLSYFKTLSVGPAGVWTLRSIVQLIFSTLSYQSFTRCRQGHQSLASSYFHKTNRCCKLTLTMCFSSYDIQFTPVLEDYCQVSYQGEIN